MLLNCVNSSVAIQKYAESNGFSVVRDFCGHGIESVFHCEPSIVHYGKAGHGLELKKGNFKIFRLLFQDFKQ